MALLQVDGVKKRFKDFWALKGVSFSVDAGEFFTLLGPSGCGKSTLLRLIAGFDAVDEGSILLDGQDLADVSPEKRPVHTVFQNYALFPHLSVKKNIAFALEVKKVPRPEQERRVAEAIADVRMQGFENKMPNELSGGQKQRVALARALVDRPKLLLLDEPLSAMDLMLREEMQMELISLQKEVGVAFIYVTHDQGEALALSHRLAVMEKGEILQIDTPRKVYEKPNSRFVADFIGTCNLWDAFVKSEEIGGRVRLDAPGLGEVEATADRVLCAEEKGAIAVRPEKIRIGRTLSMRPGENRVRGTVRDRTYLGDVTIYRAETEKGAVVEAMKPNTFVGEEGLEGEDLLPGTAVELCWPIEAGRFLRD